MIEKIERIEDVSIGDTINFGVMLFKGVYAKRTKYILNFDLHPAIFNEYFLEHCSMVLIEKNMFVKAGYGES